MRNYSLIAWIFIFWAVATNASAQSDAVARDMAYYFKAYLGRHLTAQELQEVSAEMRAYHGEPKAAQASALMAKEARWLANEATASEAASYRFRMIKLNYFDPRAGAKIKRLLVENDPPFVTAKNNAVVMLRSDVVAYAQILAFQDGGPPIAHPISVSKINALTKALREATAGRAWTPVQYSGLSSTWIAIQKAWPKLTKSEQEEARLYALRGYRAPFAQVETYSKILGSPAGAIRALDDNTEMMAASTSAIMHEQMIIELMLSNFADPTPVVIP